MWRDSETELDFLDYDYLIQAMMSIINNDALLPACIGVYGDWGSGKSSLMHMCRNRLEQSDAKIKCLSFNGWLFEDYEDAKTAILGSVLDAISEKTRLSKKAKTIIKTLYDSVDKFKLAKSIGQLGLSFFLTGGLDTLASLTAKTAITTVKKKATEAVNNIDLTELDTASFEEKVKEALQHKELRDDIRQFQEQFAKLLEESKISRLVVFIDELDRCRPDTILGTLEAMKLFIFTGRVAVVIGADERHISYAVKSKFSDIEGIQIDIGKEYLEKLIQYPIRIPRLDTEEVEVYIACLLLEDEMPDTVFAKVLETIREERRKDFMSFSLNSVPGTLDLAPTYRECYDECVTVAKQLSSVLAKGLHGNPRQCKRFLNELDMRMNMASYRTKKLDRKVLAKVMMLEYIMPSLFQKIAGMAFDETLKDELQIFENAPSTANCVEDPALTQLALWKNDNWFIDWCHIEPQLIDVEDLNLYFYFSRTSIDERISRVSRRLSPQAQTVLDKLLSKADIKVAEALQEAKALTEAEIASVLMLMGEKMRSQTQIPTEWIKAFCALREVNANLCTEGFTILMSLNGSQITAPGGVYIADYLKAPQFSGQVQGLLDKWQKENSGIVIAIKQLTNA